MTALEWIAIAAGAAWPSAILAWCAIFAINRRRDDDEPPDNHRHPDGDHHQ